MSKIFKMSHYSSQKEKRVLVPKEVKKVVPFMNVDHPIVIDEEVAAAAEENELIARAQLEAANLLHQAQLEIAELKEHAQFEINKWKQNELREIEEESTRRFDQAKEDGYQAGYEIGLSEGTNAAHHQYTTTIDQANGIVKQAEADWQKRIEQSEPFLIELSIEIAKKSFSEN